MGDNYLEAQAKNTKKRRARAAAAIGARKLVARPDQVVDQFTVDCRDGFNFSPGDVLLCFPAAGGSAVDVVQGHQSVGEVGELGGARALAAEIESAGMGRLQVCSFDPLAGSAQVERFREASEDDHQR